MPSTLARTFSNTQQALSYLQGQLGTADWQSYEYLRWQFWSYQTYPLAGAVVTSFFTEVAAGTVTTADTNMRSAGNFQGGWYFLLKTLRMKTAIKDRKLATWAGTDASTHCSDLLMGFAQAGVLQLTINSREYITLPVPFLYAPSGEGQKDLHNRGTVAAGLISAAPWVTLNSKNRGLFQFDPQIMIEPGQTFSCQLSYPSGAVPLIATGVIDDRGGANPLKVGVELDGVLFRPKQ